MKGNINLDNIKSVGAMDEGETVVMELGDSEMTFMATLTIESARDLAEQLLTSAQRAQYGQ